MYTFIARKQEAFSLLIDYIFSSEIKITGNASNRRSAGEEGGRSRWAKSKSKSMSMSMGEANSADERYERLGLREALSRDGDYAGACYELARTLRLAYAPLPKAFKSLLLDDALFALRILPDVQTGSAISSANILVQAAEAVLPKQKKALVVSEYKHSVVAHLRRAKAHHRDGDSVQLPKLGNYEGKIRPISTGRVVEYLLGAAKLTSAAADSSSSSDSDNSDSEDLLPSSSAQRLNKLWAYPKLGRT